MGEQIKHFSHEHPLQLKEEEYNVTVTQTCAGCEKSISSGPVFCCNECKYFLHKSCAELRPKIKHPLHPQHPLTLVDTATYLSPGFRCVCNGCGGVSSGFVYRCFPCDYDLDIACAFAYLPHDGHTHAFVSLNDSQPFFCYACGNKEGTEGSSRLCKICRIRVHSSCAELPQTITKDFHKHPLKLTCSLYLDGFGDDIICGACNGKMSSNSDGYFCSDCKFASHLKCPEEGEDLGAVTPQDETHKDQSPNDPGFTMFGHYHPLRFMEELSFQCVDELCDVCIQPITPPLYSCPEDNCGFLVHKSCAELPRTKQHRLHPQHPLTLLSKAPIYDGIYRCDCCKLLSNGFIYRCDECQFELDVFCGSLMMDKIQHESHKHPLLLEKTSIARECRGCGLRSRDVFVCDVCDDFAIDCGCATLPSKAWHIFDKHPLSLIYFAEGDLGEYKCGICKEKTRSPKNWFYYCDDCDFGGHPSCVLDKSRRVKFGGTFQYDFHSHPLALVEHVRKHPPCEACGEGCNGWALECGQCKCYFHREGQCFWEQFKESAKYSALSRAMRPRYAASVLATIPNVTRIKIFEPQTIEDTLDTKREDHGERRLKGKRGGRPFFCFKGIGCLEKKWGLKTHFLSG